MRFNQMRGVQPHHGYRRCAPKGSISGKSSGANSSAPPAGCARNTRFLRPTTRRDPRAVAKGILVLRVLAHEPGNTYRGRHLRGPAHIIGHFVLGLAQKATKGLPCNFGLSESQEFLKDMRTKVFCRRVVQLLRYGAMETDTAYDAALWATRHEANTGIIFPKRTAELLLAKSNSRLQKNFRALSFRNSWLSLRQIAWQSP